jgi:DNA excision repair protein ERCC-2
MDISVDWRDIFPYQPYDSQEASIKTTILVGAQGGYHVLEGACGTGKTLIGLIAGLTLVQDSGTEFNQVVLDSGEEDRPIRSRISDSLNIELDL